MDAAFFPALFRCADEASNRSQELYLNLIRAEFFSLFIAAVLSMNIFNGATFYTMYALVFLFSLVVLLARAFLKPEQDWYKCRALAESVKTLTWRYIMRADPFQGGPGGEGPRAAFRESLHELFNANRAIAEKIANDWAAGDHITPEMDRIRAMPFGERKDHYASHRIAEQRGWYTRKAGWNRRNARKWVTIAGVAYGFAICLALSRIRFPDWVLWPIEPIIVFAASVIGWMQIKKFNELAAAYTVTALEIGLIQLKAKQASTEATLSEFVNEAELAFSREHTLWIARQTN